MNRTHELSSSMILIPRTGTAPLQRNKRLSFSRSQKRVSTGTKQELFKYPAFQCDKEDLTKSNLEQKLEISRLLDTNMRLKTKIRWMEMQMSKETLDRPGNLKGMVTRLKEQYKEIRDTNDAREAELTHLKRTLKHTKIGELQTEIQIFGDECSRLRLMLNEVLNTTAQPQMANYHEKFVEQTAKIRQQRNEIKDLNKLVKSVREECEFWKEKARGTGASSIQSIDLEKIAAQKTKQADLFIKEIRKLKKQLQQVPELENEFIKVLKDGVKETWKSMGQGKDTISELQFADSLLNIGIVQTDEVQCMELFKKICGKTTIINEKDLKKYYISLNSDSALDHLSNIMQIKRYLLQDAPHIVFGTGLENIYTRQEFELKLKESKLKVPENIAELIAKDIFMFAAKDRVAGRKILQLIKDNVVDWKICTQAEEDRLDSSLIKLLEGKTGSLLWNFRSVDSEDRKVLSMNEFQAIWAQESVEFSEQQLRYMSLLFYTDSYELNQVPYESFIKAFS